MKKLVIAAMLGASLAIAGCESGGSFLGPTLGAKPSDEQLITAGELGKRFTELKKRWDARVSKLPVLDPNLHDAGIKLERHADAMTERFRNDPRDPERRSIAMLALSKFEAHIIKAEAYQGEE